MPGHSESEEERERYRRRDEIVKASGEVIVRPTDCAAQQNVFGWARQKCSASVTCVISRDFERTFAVAPSGN